MNSLYFFILFVTTMWGRHYFFFLNREKSMHESSRRQQGHVTACTYYKHEGYIKFLNPYNVFLASMGIWCGTWLKDSTACIPMTHCMLLMLLCMEATVSGVGIRNNTTYSNLYFSFWYTFSVGHTNHMFFLVIHLSLLWNSQRLVSRPGFGNNATAEWGGLHL